MKGSDDFSVTTCTSARGQHNKHPSYKSGVKIKAAPLASRQTMPPHLLRLDSTGEIARNDLMGVGRKNENQLCPDTHYTQSLPPAKSKNQSGYTPYGVLRSFVPPMPSHLTLRDMHSRKSYLVPENQTSSVFQRLSALEELHRTKLDSMASYNKMQYVKQANPCRFSNLGEFPHRPESALINYATLPPGIFPCHIFEAMHPQRTLASSHQFVPKLMQQQMPFQPSSCRSQCATSMSDSKVTATVGTAKLTSEHSPGCSSASTSDCASNRLARGVGHSTNIADTVQNNNIAATADANQTMERNGFTAKRWLGMELRNSGRVKEASECCEGCIKTETDDTRNTNCKIRFHAAAETVGDQHPVVDSCEPVKTNGCDIWHIPSGLPSLFIPNNDNCKSAISPLSDRPNKDLICASSSSLCMVKDGCPKAALGDKDAEKLEKQSALMLVSSFSQVVEAGDKVGAEKISTMPEKQEVRKLPAEMGKHCAILTLSFCDDEIDDDFWSDCDSEVVDSESQRDALAYFMTDSVGLGLAADWKAEEKYQAQVQEAVKRANTAWTQHYPSTQNRPRLTNKVQFSCGQGVDKFHVYEADPTCVMEYLANQATDAAQRRRKLSGAGEKDDDEEEDVPPDYRFGRRGECGQLLGHLEEPDEDDDDSVVFDSSPCSQPAGFQQDGEVNEELELSEQEDEESNVDEEDAESSEEAEEDGECDDLGGEDDLVDDGDIDIVFKSE